MQLPLLVWEHPHKWFIPKAVAAAFSSGNSSCFDVGKYAALMIAVNRNEPSVPPCFQLHLLRNILKLECYHNM
ncbi:hypothetical protein V6N13_111115 [Hibiscus sabdariffa]|uniref:Uncharacterized protein n=1 Tax=Hibiscus sabdariffa TaxID=183260 RepID=A0ABR2TJV8_9ROSI